MALKQKGSTAKASNKRPNSKTSTTSSSSTRKPRKSSGNAPKPRSKPEQQKTKSTSSTTTKRKPPHMRYSEKELKIPHLNGIKPVGVQKAPKAKKGKTFVDDESMNTILALVMAEKEGNIESKMMRARQLEEVREARRIEAEKRVQSKKEGLEGRKAGIKEDRKRRRKGAANPSELEGAKSGEDKVQKKSRKRVTFG